eukprot:TRINITY_DN4217_c0_g1_i1.p1 TRINITY_DN4217_c0_g1~~TRINITY_DN4217_c0_g1_i1.p1  ORF type:complete len:563 (-),score=103.64 TRINITY_DN4217_c0_g1_i1:56-1744(-)
MIYYALGALLLGGCVSSLDFSQFTNQFQVSEGYTVYWKTDATNITFGLHVSSAGVGNWVGLGIAEPSSGSMAGADMAVLDMQNGILRIQDYWASAKAYPNLDDCQSWWLLSSSVSNDGVTEAIFTRYLDTGDSQDRPINTTVGAATRMVWAVGTSQHLSYHGASTRGPYAIYLFGGAPDAPNASWSKVDLQMPGYSVPAQETTYACAGFQLKNDSDYYAKRFEFINSNTVNHSMVHHLLLYSCSSYSNLFAGYLNVPGLCNLDVTCSEVIWGWAPGSENHNMPEDVSFLLGPRGFQFVVLQIHYTNPTLTTGERDSSGVRIFYDKVPTKHLAGVLQLGDALVMAPALPANIAEVHYEFSCPSVCTAKLPNPLTLFGSALHMHGHGTMMYTTLTSASTGSTQMLNRVEFFDYGFQHILPVDAVVYPGDRVNTHCVYSTAGFSDAVPFGSGTSNEMCISFMYYYPKVASSYCTFYVYQGMNTTWCGDDSVSFENDPSVTDSVNLLNRQFGLSDYECSRSKSPGDSTGNGTTTKARTSGSTHWTGNWNLHKLILTTLAVIVGVIA